MLTSIKEIYKVLRGKEMDFEATQMQKSTVTENAGCGDGGGDHSGSKSRRQWRPPPPFLTKTFEMVDDPQINSIISWNSTGTGFIIWDRNKFSSEVLPRIFRTNNYSSFVYQLNNYVSLNLKVLNYLLLFQI